MYSSHQKPLNNCIELLQFIITPSTTPNTITPLLQFNITPINNLV